MAGCFYVLYFCYVFLKIGVKSLTLLNKVGVASYWEGSYNCDVKGVYKLLYYKLLSRVAKSLFKEGYMSFDIVYARKHSYKCIVSNLLSRQVKMMKCRKAVKKLWNNLNPALKREIRYLCTAYNRPLISRLYFKYNSYSSKVGLKDAYISYRSNLLNNVLRYKRSSLFGSVWLLNYKSKDFMLINTLKIAENSLLSTYFQGLLRKTKRLKELRRRKKGSRLRAYIIRVKKANRRKRILSSRLYLMYAVGCNKKLNIVNSVL